jgi:hypothetical protein
MSPGGVGVGDGVGDGIADGESVGVAVTGDEGVGVTLATGAHAPATMSARRSLLTELP